MKTFYKFILRAHEILFSFPVCILMLLTGVASLVNFFVLDQTIDTLLERLAGPACYFLGRELHNQTRP